MYQVELMQIRGENKGLFIRGSAGVLPQTGRSFGLMFKDGGLERSVIQTTTVLSVDELDEIILFETSNSSYMLKIVESAQ